MTKNAVVLTLADVDEILDWLKRLKSFYDEHPVPGTAKLTASEHVSPVGDCRAPPDVLAIEDGLGQMLRCFGGELRRLLDALDYTERDWRMLWNGAIPMTSFLVNKPACLAKAIAMMETAQRALQLRAEREPPGTDDGKRADSDPPAADVKDAGDDSPDSQRLRPSATKAYSQYAEAKGRKPNLDTDDEVYDWLSSNTDKDGERYELPERDTWKRYVGRARQFHGTQKNKPRAGRETGGSIVGPNEIEYQQRIGDD